MPEESLDTVRVHVIVGGRVQGVWFRASTRRVAQGLGLGGQVRNLPTGEVEAVFEGPRIRVEEAVGWCRKGPPGARVDHVDVNWGEPKGEATFEISYD